MSLVIERLAPHHARDGFGSGVEPLDRYLRTQAGQDARRRVSACFVAVDQGRTVAGYYTLAMGGVLLSDLTREQAKGLPRYPTVPVARLGRLAVDGRWRGRGLGGALLWDAAGRTARAEIAAYALLVDAKDEAAVAFYRHHGFLTLAGDAQALFLPLAAVAPRPDVGERAGGSPAWSELWPDKAGRRSSPGGGGEPPAQPVVEGYFSSRVRFPVRRRTLPDRDRRQRRRVRFPVRRRTPPSALTGCHLPLRGRSG